MSYRKLFLLLVFGSFGFLFTVNAQCDYATQNDLRVKASHVVANCSVQNVLTGTVTESPWLNENGERDLIEEEIATSISTIYNVTEDLYVTVQNLNTEEIITYYYSDTDDGTISWESIDLTQIVPYEIKVYSNHSDCQGEELYKLQIVSPKLNPHSLMSYCYGLDTYYCQEYITEEIYLSEDKLKEMAYEEQDKLEDDSDGDTKIEEDDFWTKYQNVILPILCVVIVGGFAFVIVKRKLRSDVL